MGRSSVRSLGHWLPAALAVLMIAVESTAMMSADNTSRWLYPLWLHLFGPISPDRWALVHHYIRKTGHFTGYGLVSLCFFYGWRKTLHLTSSGAAALWMRSALLAVCCAFLVASADEYHQTFLPSRTARVSDVAIDTSGAVAAQLAALWLMPLLVRRSRARLIQALLPEVE